MKVGASKWLLALSVALVACATTVPEGKKAAKTEKTSEASSKPKGHRHQSDAGVVTATKFSVLPQTTLPRRMGRPLTESQSGAKLAVSPGLVLVSRVERPRVEMREGPGTQFSLVDQILERDQVVVVFERTGSWYKVLLPESGALGYVHHQTIALPDSTRVPVEIPASTLPAIFARRDVKISYDYETEQKLPVEIRKGAVFAMLKRNRWRVLVWLPDTGTVAWLDRKDFE